MAREMKDSGIEWIGEIPHNWNVVKCKYFLSIKSGDAVRNEDLSDEKMYDVYGGGEKLGTYNKYNVDKNNLLIGRVGARCGCITQIENKAWATDNALIVTTACNIKYMFYLLSHLDLNRLNTSNAQPLITSSKIYNCLSAFVSDNNEQQKISAYLDSECAKIDDVITKTKATIEEYKKLKQSVITEAVTKGIRPNREMKDSGIEWIGEIPKEWTVEKGKHILTLLERPVKDDDGVITCFRDGEVTLRSNRREEGYTVSIQETGYQGIEPNDLVVHGMDGFAGAIGISDSRGKATPVLNVLDSSEYKKYIMYYLRSMAYNGVFLALSTGIRVRTCDTNWNKLKELPYPLPSIEEQREISEYIDKSTLRINEIISQKSSLLTELESYKKSLIYEYVTGKKEVE